MKERTFHHNGVTARLICGDCEEILPEIGAVHHTITDPPYSEHVHGKSRRGGFDAPPLDGSGRSAPCSFSRKKEFGFESLSDTLRIFCADRFARITTRWVLCFSDVEMSHLWREDLVAHGLDYVRTGAWVKLGATPQFTGDRPAAGFEAITICHAKGRKKWNGGGTHAVWSVPIELNRGGGNERLHPTQKPLPLMLKLVRLFTDAKETVLDPFMGSATTGVACLEAGRSFIGIERDPAHFQTSCERIERLCLQPALL